MKTTYVPDAFKKNWHAAFDAYEALRMENERLQKELAEIERRHKIALDNAYYTGYEACKADMRAKRR